LPAPEVLLDQKPHVGGEAPVFRLGTLFDFLHKAGVRPEANEFFFCAHIVKNCLTSAHISQLLFSFDQKAKKIKSPAEPVFMRVSIEIL
jgi:hypothetical protein